MPIYETLCVLHPELPETRVKEIIAWMQKIIEGAQGSVLQMDQWGMRDLAFRAKKQRRGYYLRVECDAQPTMLKELERNLRLSEDVLRFMSTVRSAPTSVQAPIQSPAVAPAPPPDVPDAPPAQPAEAGAESQ